MQEEFVVQTVVSINLSKLDFKEWLVGTQYSQLYPINLSKLDFKA